jgi:enoyl-CoA hydratase/carnithine racemase
VPHVAISESDGVAVLTVDRPPANAMNVELLEELVAALRSLESDPPAALVLSGREGVFSAGADLKAVPGYGPEEQLAMVDGINAMAIGVYGLACPVVGAISGHAIAGGLVLALCSDVRVASAAGRYGLTEVRVGVPYPQAALAVVRAELSAQAARWLAFGNQLVGADECHRLGVFDEVLEPAAVQPRALALGAELASFPRDTYLRTKRELRREALEQMRSAAADDPLRERWVS